MNKSILFIKWENSGCPELMDEFRRQGYHVVEYNINGTADEFTEIELSKIKEILYDNFFYFTISEMYHEELYKICLHSATKYVSCGKAEEVQEKMKHILNEEEASIYDTIHQLASLKKEQHGTVKSLKDLKKVEEDCELCRLTDLYFAEMEEERALSFLLKEQLMEYLDKLLAKRTADSWREIVLWNKRHECRKLCNSFWQFFLMQKATAIFAEEMIQYYETGENLSILQFGSFQELSEGYFYLLLLLRRLNYKVAVEEEADIVEFVKKRKLSPIFVKHVIEQNQIEDKEIVHKRLEELLIKYGQ